MFGYRKPPDFITAPDIGRYGTLLDIAPFEINAAPITGDLFGGITTAERPVMRAVFNNQDGFWSRLAGSETLLSQAMEAILYYGGSSLYHYFRGEILNYEPDKDEFMVEWGEGRILYNPIKLRRAEVYPKPRNPADLLPMVYGDFLSPGVNSAAEDAGGATPAICINTETRDFLVSDSRCDSTPPLVYVGDTLQAEFTPSGDRVYEWRPDEDYGALGRRIAYLRFNVNVDGEVSVRIRGTINDQTGQMISDPIETLQHFLITQGGWQASDFDPYSIVPTQQDLAARSYSTHWCFLEDRSAKEWIVEFMKHYWLDTIITARSQLAFLFDSIPPAPERVLTTIRVHADLGGDDPEKGITCVIDGRNLVNAITIKGRRKWHTGESMGEMTIEDLASIRLHQRRDYIADLPGVRTIEHATSWAAQLNGRTTFKPTAIGLEIRHLFYPFLMPGMYVALVWRYAPWPDVGGWQETFPGILKIRNVRVQFPNPHTGRPAQMGLDTIYTGYHYRRTTYGHMIDNNGQTIYAYVNEAGTFSGDPGIPHLDALNTTPWRYLQRQSPDGTTWYVYPQTNAAGQGLQFVISTTSPGGVGSADPEMGFVNRHYQTWRIRVSNAGQLITTIF